MRDDDYSTSDLGLAAFLLALGFPLLDLRGSPGRPRVFVFPVAAAANATRYFAGATVEARRYAAAIRDLKGLVAQAGRP